MAAHHYGSGRRAGPLGERTDLKREGGEVLLSLRHRTPPTARPLTSSGQSPARRPLWTR
ncbi:hypothetical protein ACIRQP_14325 [Streptomyces sp. NPDC102274]|uniref:hypothetical protein n=1 Tax=Streptomyces sp. NPDC102274 TaxID=3366151 RepID=UPI0037FC6A98